MRRFFTDPLGPDCTRTLLDQDESRHLCRVLKVSAGETIELIDGCGMRYTGTVERLGKQVAVSIRSRSREIDDSAPITVCQGDLKSGKMDFLVEKCTELGVRQFMPFTAGRSQGRVDGARRDRRRSRQESIVKSASKQCGRCYFMQVEPETTFDELIGLDCGPPGRKIMLWEKAGSSTLGDLIGGDRASPVYLMIGPEGGFSDEEAARAHAAGWLQASLGPRILRAETATVAAVAVVNHLLGRI